MPFIVKTQRLCSTYNIYICRNRVIGWPRLLGLLQVHCTQHQLLLIGWIGRVQLLKRLDHHFSGHVQRVLKRQCRLEIGQVSVRAHFVFCIQVVVLFDQVFHAAVQTGFRRGLRHNNTRRCL